MFKFKSFNFLYFVMFLSVLINCQNLYARIPHEFKNGEVSDAEQINNNFNYLDQLLPVGTILPWHKNFGGMNIELSDSFVPCNGQLIEDSESPLYGNELPDLNGMGLFLRGSKESGIIQMDELKSHNHSAKSSNAGSHSHSASTSYAGTHSHSGNTSQNGSHTHTGTANNSGKHGHNSEVGNSETMAGRGGGYKLVTETGTCTSGNVSVGHKCDGPFIDKNDANYTLSWHRHNIPLDGDHTHRLSINSNGLHAHSFETSTGGNHNHEVSIDESGLHMHTITVNKSGGEETRPKNMSIVWVMRIK